VLWAAEEIAAVLEQDRMVYEEAHRFELPDHWDAAPPTVN
jgi:hypothetical protein